ncbi:MAG: PEP-CTERM sorting domain-containing protein [Pirellulales bacterium]
MLLDPLFCRAERAVIVLVLWGGAPTPALLASHIDGTPQRASHVEGVATQDDSDDWVYQYMVFNDTPLHREQQGLHLIVDWELPWFGDAGIDLASILAPSGWEFEIEAIGVPNSGTGWTGIAPWQDPSDPFYFGDTSSFTFVEHVIHWYAAPAGERTPPAGAILEGDSLDGFGFVSPFAPTNAPYSASWFELDNLSGDPLFPLGAFPNSPAAQAVVPEPSAFLLFGIGSLALLCGSRCRRFRSGLLAR